MKTSFSVLSVIVFAFVSVAVVMGADKAACIGDKGPDFTKIPAAVLDKESGEIKETVLNLADVKEDVVVLVFVANHCPFVVANEQRLNEFVTKYSPEEGKEAKVKVIAFCVSLVEADKLPAIKAYMKKHKSAYVYGYDATQEVGRAYGATNTPQYFVLDKDRKIRYIGALDDVPTPSATKKPAKHYLHDAVDALLKGEKPPVEKTRHPGCGIDYKSR